MSLPKDVMISYFNAEPAFFGSHNTSPAFKAGTQLVNWAKCNLPLVHELYIIYSHDSSMIS